MPRGGGNSSANQYGWFARSTYDKRTEMGKKTSRGPIAAILLGEALLEDFMSEGEFVEKMLAMRWRVIREFVNAGPSSKPGRAVLDRSTCGYIASVGDQLSSLTTYLMGSMGPRVLDKVYSPDSLPRRYHGESQRNREYVARYVCHVLIMRQLVLLRDSHDLWYLEGWMLPQSVMDEYLTRLKNAKANYRNQRAFHGRPNRDRSNGTVPGVSVGASR